MRSLRSDKAAMDILRWAHGRVDQTFRTRNWAGRGVVPALRGVKSAQAHWRPSPEQHSIAEIALHMAYWKDAVSAHLRRIPWRYDEQLNWRSVAPTMSGWANACAELRASHKRLRRSLQGFPAAQLLQPLRPHHPDKYIDLVIDIATHDTYHAAQIFVLRRLAQRAKR